MAKTFRSSPLRVSIGFDGLSHVNGALKALPEKIQNRVIRLAIRKAAEPVLEQARANAPVEVGTLRDSLQIQTFRGRKRKTLIGVSISPGPTWFTGDSYYAGFIEFGYVKAPSFQGKDGKWYSVKRRRDKRGYRKVEAKPFLRPALHQAKAQVESIFRKLVSRGVAREAVKIARAQLKERGTAVETLDNRAIRKVARSAARG
jgi:HK97 gp10 family phage protein